MCLLIRPADPVRDYSEMAELRSTCEGHVTTADELLALDAHAKDGSVMYRAVGEADGELVACGDAFRSIWFEPGAYAINVCVLPDKRRSGYGAGLASHLEEFALRQGAGQLRARVRDSEAIGKEFAERLGYRQVAHTFESVLELASFDPARFPPDCAAVDLQIFSFAETPMGEAEKRKLWDLNTGTSCDEPSNAPDYRPTFEEFSANVIDAFWFDPAGQFFAADGDEWVGMSAVGRLHEGFYNLFTGVRRSYRGRGIALALKVLALSYAKAQGAETVRTNNDSRNAPMLAINEALGYQAEPGWFNMRKSALNKPRTLDSRTCSGV